MFSLPQLQNTFDFSPQCVPCCCSGWGICAASQARLTPSPATHSQHPLPPFPLLEHIFPASSALRLLEGNSFSRVKPAQSLSHLLITDPTDPSRAGVGDAGEEGLRGKDLL